MNLFFHRLAKSVAKILGSWYALFLAILLTLIWIGLGFVGGFTQNWFLTIGTIDTVFTFLIVFVIQHTQMRDTEEVHLQINELIKSIKGARNMLIGIDQMTDEELEELHLLLRLLLHLVRAIFLALLTAGKFVGRTLLVVFSFFDDIPLFFVSMLGKIINFPARFFSRKSQV